MLYSSELADKYNQILTDCVVELLNSLHSDTKTRIIKEQHPSWKALYQECSITNSDWKSNKTPIVDRKLHLQYIPITQEECGLFSDWPLRVTATWTEEGLVQVEPIVFLKH